MKSSIVKRSIELKGHKTSVSLEDEFWSGLRSIAESSRTPLPDLLQTIDAKRGQANLSSAIRVFVLVHYRELAAAQAAAKALDQSPEATPAITPADSTTLPTKGEA
ncbi:MAG: aryl-sulfate sulfotransferase [Rhodopseudomonas sp.]|nr:aryl-sulfate sulfotransferase [Rhodopseudomonas sp.]